MAYTFQLSRRHLIAKNAGFMYHPSILHEVGLQVAFPRAFKGRVYMGRRSEKIARKKGATDAKRAKAFARIGKRIVMAVKSGGPDEVSNKQLSDILKEAKAYNVPKENINRAIKRGSEGDAANFKESLFEAYGHGGCGILVNVLSDNGNRAATEVRTAMKKGNLKMAEPGSVSFNFDRKGRYEVLGEVDEDAVFERALEMDLEDIEIFEEEIEEADGSNTVTTILTEPTELYTLADGLESIGIKGEPALVFWPKMKVSCSEEDFEANMNAIQLLEDLDDVDSVEHNMDI